MSTYNPRVSADQQYQLIMDYRSSGLTDCHWCKAHGIHPGTFYNWVSRLQKKACHNIPDPVFREYPCPPAVQDEYSGLRGTSVWHFGNRHSGE